jgi:hypothetical protein
MALVEGPQVKYIFTKALKIPPPYSKQEIRQNKGDISNRRHLFRHLDHEEAKDAENLNATAQRMVQKHAVSHFSVFLSSGCCCKLKS